jgi:hypothetical protein
MNDRDHVTSVKVGLLEIGTRTQIDSEFRPEFYSSIKVQVTSDFINVTDGYTTAYCKILKFRQWSVNMCMCS